MNMNYAHMVLTAIKLPNSKYRFLKKFSYEDMA